MAYLPNPTWPLQCFLWRSSDPFPEGKGVRLAKTSQLYPKAQAKSTKLSIREKEIYYSFQSKTRNQRPFRTDCWEPNRITTKISGFENEGSWVSLKLGRCYLKNTQPNNIVKGYYVLCKYALRQFVRLLEWWAIAVSQLIITVNLLMSTKHSINYL